MNMCVVTSIVSVVVSIGSVVMTVLIGQQRDLYRLATQRLRDENERLSEELMRALGERRRP